MLQFQPQEHLMHSYIVASQSEQARDRLSLDLAAAMLCRSDGVRPCRTCRDCRKVYDGVHPDVIYVAPDPDAKVPTIKVDQIRSIAATAYILPSEAEKKVYVLRQADTMNLSAQNAFLKLLEENVPFFSLKLRYQGDMLMEAVLDGRYLKGAPA